MEITFPLTPDDYWQFTRFTTRRTPALRRVTLLRAAFLPVLLAVEFAFLRLSWPVYALLLAALSAAWVLYLRWATRRATSRLANLRVGAVGLHTLRIGAEGLRQQDTVMDSSVRWEKIIEIARSPHHIAFFLGPSYAFIVPVGAFQDGAQADAFLETAQSYWRSARDGSTPAVPEGGSWPPPPVRMT